MPRPRRAPGDGVEPCPAGKPLGAHIELRTSGTANGIAFSRTGKVKVWFDLAPAGPSQWRYELIQPWSASHLTWRTEASGCVDLPDQYGEVCRCGPSRASGVVDFRRDSGYGSFHPLDPLLSVHLPDSIMNSADVPFECVRRDAGGSRRAANPDTRLMMIDTHRRAALASPMMADCNGMVFIAVSIRTTHFGELQQVLKSGPTLPQLSLAATFPTLSQLSRRSKKPLRDASRASGVCGAPPRFAWDETSLPDGNHSRLAA